MFLLFSNKRYYILENKKGQICLIDGPFLSVRQAQCLMSGQQWVELLTSKQLAKLLE